MISSYVVITRNLGQRNRAATIIGWARWLGEGENQVFPTHFLVLPYNRCKEVLYNCSVLLFVGCNTSNHNNRALLQCYLFVRAKSDCSSSCTFLPFPSSFPPFSLILLSQSIHFWPPRINNIVIMPH